MNYSDEVLHRCFEPDLSTKTYHSCLRLILKISHYLRVSKGDNYV